MGPNRVLGHTGGSQGTILIFQSLQDLGPSTRFTGKRTWLWTIFFFKIDYLDLGTCPRTQQDTWTHVRFTVNKFDFSDLTGLWTVNHVHREEELGPDKLF